MLAHQMRTGKVSDTKATTTWQMPAHHRDPFDRTIVAQAISEPLRLLTADKVLKRYTDLVDLV